MASELMSANEEWDIELKALVNCFREDFKVGQETQTKEEHEKAVRVYHNLVEMGYSQRLIDLAFSEAASDI
ncbi:hypothetical protein KBB76_00195 [Candidatus Saccharibacteria bacterium]|jgi:Holliday junction resolvasome RuvABC DNA-binding subunit|nr:hypothetical protein [Candidatus Saccharibacteria bacterium]HOR23559.1 hypothetical protein [Candidatus Saccharibacteria bacterium]HPW47809.1 hypothetical protein [Candidatus Saccharibacteria bacterium]